MTLVIAAGGRDFVILGADNRGTIEEVGGTRVEINIVEKIFKITNHSAILIYGDSGQSQYFIDRFTRTRHSDADVSIIAENFAEFCQNEVRRLSDVPTHPQYYPTFGFIVAGLDKVRGAFKKPRCFELNSVRGFRLQFGGDGFLINGKPMLAYYLFSKKYKLNMEVKPLSELVATALYDTAHVDGDVGIRARMARIEKNGYYPTSAHDIKSLVQERWADEESET